MQFKDEAALADYLGFEDIRLSTNKPIYGKRICASNYYIFGNYYIDKDLNLKLLSSHTIIFESLEYSFVIKNGIFYLELI